jgi:ATP-dependent DNA helicase RecG
MALPINIKELIHGKVVEWERLEFKAGWNPEEILHSICAFANDLNNWGGGYIIVGIETMNGVPQFPPKGIPLATIDGIQGELINICYKIQPNYLPIIQPYIIDDQHILVIWAPAGDMRPYSGPSTLGNDARRQYYIRAGSRSIVAQGANHTRLIELTAKVPFDDRINQQAQLHDLDLGLIREFLQEVGSELFDESVNIPFPELCRQMQIARGAVEYLRPVNAGLMFFNREPHNFFNRAWIELAIHPDDTGRNFTTETFKGPLHHQIRNCLAYLKNNVFRTEVRKITGQAESVTISNYPFNALEEVLSNAVFHKNYADEAPIEIQVFPDKITVLSYPGPMPPITNIDLQQRRVVSRAYRNRRIGDFLKELDLTEGKSTGFPIIRDTMAANGNPEPVFYTDKDQILFLVTLPCHPELQGTKSVTKMLTMTGTKLTMEVVEQIFNKGVDLQALSDLLDIDISEFKNEIRDRLSTRGLTKSLTKSLTKIPGIIDYLEKEKSRVELFEFLGLENQTLNFNNNIKPLIDYGFIEMTLPDIPKSRYQKYRLTEKGKKLLKNQPLTFDQ